MQEKIIAELDIIFKKIIAIKKQKKSFVVIERDGKVARLEPEEFE